MWRELHLVSACVVFACVFVVCVCVCVLCCVCVVFVLVLVFLPVVMCALVRVLPVVLCSFRCCVVGFVVGGVPVVVFDVVL